MANQFFEKPILNSPYEHPARHWELDHGQPTQQIVEKRRPAEYITPLPKPKKRKGQAEQTSLLLDDTQGLSTQAQEYQKTAAIINAVRQEVGKWRALPNPNTWRVTPETARLLQYWRHHKFSGVRPFFCQVEAVETVIWLTEVAPQLGKGVPRVIDLSATPFFLSGSGYVEGTLFPWTMSDFSLMDAKEKKTTMDIYWVPGVNNLKQYGRWAFAEFTDVFQMQHDFAKKVEAEFDRMITAQIRLDAAP